MKKVKLLLIAAIASMTCSSLAQNETKNWHFGQYAALDFNTSPPTILSNSGLAVDEGCTSASDANGNLLFYGHGQYIFDKSNALMAGSSNPLLSGHSSS